MKLHDPQILTLKQTAERNSTIKEGFQIKISLEKDNKLPKKINFYKKYISCKISAKQKYFR